jgi:isoquinoline 1-oxidoreductase
MAHANSTVKRWRASKGSAARNPQSAVPNPIPTQEEIDDLYTELNQPLEFHFAMERRQFVQILGAGVLVSVVGVPLLAQQPGRGRGRRGGGGFGAPANVNLSARIHLGDDGTITVLSGKVDCGQGARGEFAQVAAEELRVPVSQVRCILADTSLVPNDGLTAGSTSTPRTVPAVRQAAAAIRRLLADHAATKWNVAAGEVSIAEGRVAHAASNQSLTYAQLASDAELLQRFAQPASGNVELTPPAEWKTMGQPQAMPAARDKVTGKHQYPSDIVRPGMLYGRVLRPPTYRGQLVSVDLAPAQAMEGVVAVRDGQFVGVAAPTSFLAGKALEAIRETAQWENPPHPSSAELHDYLRANARGGVPANPFAADVAAAPKAHKATYHVPYVQHAPLEPRVAVAEWADGSLTVWTGSQNPFGVQGELQRAFGLTGSAARVIVPDFGSGYGGKHSGETAVEAARLARAAGKPVQVRWTREEEFTWAQFRPAAVIDCEASLDDQGRLTSWWFVTINPGGQSMDSPYDLPGNRKQSRSVTSQPPLRHGSYRALASTANTFGRESFMDEMAALAGADPLEFRLARLEVDDRETQRLRAVLEEAARGFNWAEKVRNKQPNRGVGLACSYDKGSVVACCAEVEIDPATKDIRVVHVCEAFECGAIINPNNVRNQVEGAITMGLGPALTEEMKFKDGVIENAAFRLYRVPHFRDVPTIDVRLVNRPNDPSVGAGETPIIVIAPAIANAVFHATGERIRKLPIRLA